MRLLAPPALIFLCNSILFISFFTRLPSIQADMGVNKATLGLALLGGAVGTILALPVAGRVNNRFTPRRTAAASLIILAIVLPLLAMLPYAGFVITFIFFAFVRTLLEVAQNMVSTGIELQSGVKVLSRSHGFWSVGLLLGSVASGWAAGQGASAPVHLAGVSIVIFLSALVVLKITPDLADQRITQSGARAAIFIRPSRNILMIAVMLFGIAVIEGAVYDWGMFLLRARITDDPTATGILYAFFTIGMGAMRMIGDRLRDLFRPSVLLRASAFGVAFGLSLVLIFDAPWIAAIGLAIVGCGVALNYPLAVSTVMGLKGSNSPAENLAALSLVMLFATISIPPLLGGIAELWGIAMAFTLILPLTILTFLMAPVSEGKGLDHS